MTTARSIAAFEGFYGAPFSHAERCALIDELPAIGVNTYWYGPKDDPFQRARWREPYPSDQMSQFEELIERARRGGVDLAITMSPGMDPGDEDADVKALAAKLRAFYRIGVSSFGVAFDDTPAGGVDLGAAHGSLVAAVAAALPSDARMFAVPVDYATDRVTPYLRAFADAIPAETSIGWTGPAIVSATVDPALAARLQEELGRPLAFGDNYPVSDGGMEAVLHLGPAPYRDARLHETVAITAFNLGHRPRVSRFGLAVAARAIHEPSEDREAGWRTVLETHPGLESLALACRSWLTDPGPFADLIALIEPAFEGDGRLFAILETDPASGLDAAIADEAGPWLSAVRWEAFVMNMAIHAVRGSMGRAEAALLVAEGWRRIQLVPEQVFGIRRAVYPVTYATDAGMRLDPDASIIRGENLTDLVCRAALEKLR